MKSRSRKNLGYMTRRQALALMGGCGIASVAKNPVDILLHGLTDGIFAKAQAESGVSPRNFVYLALNGGPNRWVFDQLLNPYGGAISPNAHILTRFSGTGTNAGRPEYATSPITIAGVTLQLPWLWRTTLPIVGGGTVPMAQLATNWLAVRGVDMLADGHENNRALMLRPSGAAPSLDGQVADSSRAPLPAVAIPGFPSHVYRSRRGIGLSFGSGNNLATSLLGGFNNTSDGTAPHRARRDAVRLAVERGLASLGAQSAAEQPGSEALWTMRNRAEGMLRAGVGEAANEYPRLLEKYRNLIKAAFAMPIEGISDRPVPFGDPAVMVQPRVTSFTDGNDLIARNPDLRTLLTSSSSVNNMAEGFAIAEFLISRGFSSSVGFGLGGIVSGINYQNVLNIKTGQVMGDLTGNRIHNFDSHDAGAVTALIIDSYLYRSLATCLYEFIEQLKGRSLFSETVIQIGAEFTRIPRDDMSGSDHGWSAQTTSVFSGAISRPLVMGNILVDGNRGVQRRTGTWGNAAPLLIGAANRALGIGETTATIAALLRVKPLIAASMSLIAESGGSVTPVVEPAAQKGG
jgi:hypothetical protein